MEDKRGRNGGRKGAFETCASETKAGSGGAQQVRGRARREGSGALGSL